MVVRGGGGDIPNLMVYHPSYNETRWRVMRDNLGPMRGFLKVAIGLGLTLPPSSRDTSKKA